MSKSITRLVGIRVTVRTGFNRLRDLAEKEALSESKAQGLAYLVHILQLTAAA